MKNIFRFKRIISKFTISILVTLLFIFSFYCNVQAKIIEWGGIQLEDIPDTFYVESKKGINLDVMEQIAYKYNLKEEKCFPEQTIARDGRTAFVYKIFEEFKGDVNLLKELKSEKALKLVHPVYKRLDIERETGLTYSDLIIVFFNEEFDLADIEEEILTKYNLTLVSGIVGDDFRAFKEKSKSFQIQLEKELAEVEKKGEERVKSYLLRLAVEASKNNYGDVKVFRLLDPKNHDIFAICEELKSLEAVKKAYPNCISLIKPSSDTYPNDQFFCYQWHYHMINCPKGWDLTHGSSSVIIAVLDSGVQTNHPDLSYNIVTGYNALNPGSSPVDEEGHGTNCAGLASARTNNYRGVAGVGWYCKIMPIKCWGSSGGTDELTFVNGINYANTNGADVMNMSFHWDGTHDLFDLELYNSYIDNIYMVAATGNYDVSHVDYPARNPYVSGVGAVDSTGYRVRAYKYGWGSNYGYDDYGDYAVHFMAPGISLTTTSPTYYVGPYYTLNYNHNFGGTSGACPHVAGLVGLLRAKKSSLTNIETYNSIYNTCDPVSYQGSPYYCGAGIVDAWAALDYAISHY